MKEKRRKKIPNPFNLFCQKLYFHIWNLEIQAKDHVGDLFKILIS